MILAQKVVKMPDGSYETQWDLSENDMTFLLSYAINQLLAMGIATVKPEEFRGKDKAN